MKTDFLARPATIRKAIRRTLLHFKDLPEIARMLTPKNQAKGKYITHLQDLAMGEGVVLERLSAALQVAEDKEGANG